MMSFDTIFCIVVFAAYYIIAWSYLSEMDKWENDQNNDEE